MSAIAASQFAAAANRRGDFFAVNYRSLRLCFHGGNFQRSALGAAEGVRKLERAAEARTVRHWRGALGQLAGRDGSETCPGCRNLMIQFWRARCPRASTVRLDNQGSRPLPPILSQCVSAAPHRARAYIGVRSSVMGELQNQITRPTEIIGMVETGCAITGKFHCELLTSSACNITCNA